jgi:hypothetical protein
MLKGTARGESQAKSRRARAPASHARVVREGKAKVGPRLTRAAKERKIPRSLSRRSLP